LTETLLPWLELSLRWGHVVIGSLWIGASFYLISWENKFNRAHGLGDAIEGEFWTIQGGDFYRVEKLRRAPPQLPAVLHWFKYEAYLTWLTGFVLLCLLFYAKPSSLVGHFTTLEILKQLLRVPWMRRIANHGDSVGNE
jgi:uncharacterized membrane protein